MNTELLLRVADAIENDPGSYDQSMWARRGACGTTMCIAGHACVLSGWRFEFDPAMHIVDSGLVSSPDLAFSRVDAEYVAQDLLGFTEEEAESLFDAGGQDWPSPYQGRTDAASVVAMLRSLAAGAITLGGGS